MTTGVMRLKLNSIGAGTTNFMAVGIIIAMQSPKVIVSKKGIFIIVLSSLFIKTSIGTNLPSII